MDVLYYSNYCKYSKDLLTNITKLNIKNNIYFICVDKRTIKSNIVYIQLENGKEVKLPDIIKTVPSMILFSRGNIVLEGNSIYKYVNESESKLNKNKDEPNAFSLNYGHFTSDTYSFLTTDPEEMNAKGNAGMEQMHNYFSIQQGDDIMTPPEDYISTRLTSDSTNLNKIIEQRESEIPKHENPLTGRTI